MAERVNTYHLILNTYLRRDNILHDSSDTVLFFFSSEVAQFRKEKRPHGIRYMYQIVIGPLPKVGKYLTRWLRTLQYMVPIWISFFFVLVKSFFLMWSFTQQTQM